MTDHTPTPWLADPDNRPGYEWNVHVVEASNPDMRICFMSAGPNSEANAAFIVKASNHFDDLVACVRASLNMVDGDGNPPDWDFLRRTLKSAETKDA